MPEWMTNRFMAPVYALLISFGTALVLGAAMSPSGTTTEPETTDPATTLTIRLVAQQQAEKGMFDDDGPVAELQGVQVHIKRDGVDKNVVVGKDGVATLAPAPGLLTVCVSLPEGWTGWGPLPGTPPRSPCWNVVPENGAIALRVVKEG